MRAPLEVETARLTLRKPTLDDADAIFERYSSDPEVTRYLGWPRHHATEEARAFVEASDTEWERWPAGPYLITARGDGSLLGGTGLAFETPQRASTGYVLARDAWGLGYATEALGAMVVLASDLGIRRLHALCHPSHRASSRVLEKCGFELEGTRRCHSEFPNLAPGVAADALCFVRTLTART